MDCPVHAKEQLLFIHNISMHLIDGSIETLPLYECKKCNQYYISTRSLQNWFSRKLHNGKIVNNYYFDNKNHNTALNNSQPIPHNKKQPATYEEYAGPGNKKINVYLYNNKIGKNCTKCYVELIDLKISYPIKKHISHTIGKRCPSCERNYLHVNNYLAKKVCFNAINKEILSSLLIKDNGSSKNNTVSKSNIKKNEKTSQKKASNKLPQKTLNTFKCNNLILNKNEVSYLMCELLNIRTQRMTTVTITSTTIPRDIDETNRIITVGSELGQLCLKAVANDIEVINYMNVSYSINRFARYDIPFVEAYRDKTYKKLIVKIDEYPLDPKEIDKKVVYVYMKLNNSCLHNKHNIENVTMNVSNIRDNRKMDVNVFHCLTCGKYFINYDQLKEYIDKKQIPAFKYSIVKGTFDSMNEISELMLYGYTVKEGALRENERQGILAWILDCNLMTKNQIINNIQYKIDYNGKKELNAKAKIKWEDDLAFVSGYKINTQARIKGSLVWRN